MHLKDHGINERISVEAGKLTKQGRISTHRKATPIKKIQSTFKKLCELIFSLYVLCLSGISSCTLNSSSLETQYSDFNDSALVGSIDKEFIIKSATVECILLQLY
jgi:hypothetical protein